MKIRNVFMLMAAFALASCSKSEMDEPATVGLNEIALGSPVIHTGSASSRMPYEATTISASDSLHARVLTSQATTFATLYCNGTMTFKGSGATTYNKPVTSGKYDFTDAGNTTLYIAGLYPSVVGAGGWDLTTAAGKASLIFTGKEDVMFAQQVETKRDEITAGTHKTLAFSHKLTLMKVAFKGDADAIDSETKVKGLKLSKVNGKSITNKVVIDLTSTVATPVEPEFSGTLTEMACYKIGTDSVAFTGTPSGTPVHVVDANATSVKQAYIIAPPVAEAKDKNNEYTFTVSYDVKVGGNVEARTAVVDVDLRNTGGTDAFTGSTVGKSFDLVFTFIGKQIEVKASVSPWTAGGGVNMPI